MKKDESPRTAILMSDAQRLIAQDAWNSTALYLVSNGTLIHRFPAPDWISDIAISADETLLLITGDSGTLSLWKIDTGEQLWEQSPCQSQLRPLYGPRFAHNGESCIVLESTDRAHVLQSQTGQRLGVVQFPPLTTILCPQISLRTVLPVCSQP